MNKYREQLEGTAQLFRIRRMKRLLAVVLVVVLLVLSVYAMAIGGAALKPLFLPIESFLPLVLVLLLIAGLASFVFRSLEIRYSRRDSQRYLIAKSSIRRSAVVLVLSAVLGGLLLFPVAAQVGAGLSDVQIGYIDPSDTVGHDFTNQDVFGVTRYLEGRIRVTSPSQLADVVVLGGDAPPQSGTAGLGSIFYFSIKVDRRYEYNVTIRNISNERLQYEMLLRGAVMAELTTVVPAILLAFAVANFFWIAYASPLRQRYEAASIYSARYEEAADVGERTFADYYRAPRAPVSRVPVPEAATSLEVPIRPSIALPEVAPPPPPPEPVAVEPLQSIESIEPEVTPEALVEEGSRLFSAGQHDAALAKFDEALEVDPGNVLALLAGGAALLRLGRRDEAMGQYDQVLRTDPRNPKALQARAQITEGEGQWAQAAAAWAAYLQAVPGDVDARLRRAECILSAGDRGAAVKALEEALFLAPSDPRIRARIESLTVNVPALLSRALVASASGQTQAALGDFDMILSVDPDNVNALVGKGVALRRAGRHDEAINALDWALAKQPGNSAALRTKGSILEEKNEYEKALDVYEDLLEWNPRDPELWALQGAVLEKLGEQEEALASYHEAIKIDPNNPDWKAREAALESSRKGQEAFLEELFSIKGVGPARARALLAAGYKSLDSLQRATEDELANVRGMTRKIAADIYRHFHPEGVPPPPEGPAPMR